MSQKLVLSRFKALDRWSGFSILPPIIVFTMVPIGESILTIMIMIITITIMITMIINLDFGKIPQIIQSIQIIIF